MLKAGEAIFETNASLGQLFNLGQKADLVLFADCRNRVNLSRLNPRVKNRDEEPSNGPARLGRAILRAAPYPPQMFRNCNVTRANRG